MSDENPTIETSSDNATLLLAAVEELKLDPSVVTTGDGVLSAPQEVFDKAFGKKTTRSKADPKDGE